MKNSTRRSSSKPSSAARTISNVKGILFFSKHNGVVLYITVKAWESAGCPPDCCVYDNVHMLLASGIPVADAICIEGRWIRKPLSDRVPTTNYRKTLCLDRKIIKSKSIPVRKTDFITEVDALKKKLR